MYAHSFRLLTLSFCRETTPLEKSLFSANLAERVKHYYQMLDVRCQMLAKGMAGK